MSQVDTFQHSSDDGAHHVASHHVGGTHMDVEHNPEERAGTHTVSVGHNDSIFAPGPTAVFRYPAARDPTKAFLATPHNSVRDRLRPPPSEQLRALIEVHARDPHGGGASWAALLDKLVEEYPETGSAVDAHTAARYIG